MRECVCVCVVGEWCGATPGLELAALERASLRLDSNLGVSPLPLCEHSVAHMCELLQLRFEDACLCLALVLSLLS